MFVTLPQPLVCSLDSTLDRYSESIILLGLLWYVLQRPDLHDIIWPFANEQRWMINVIFIAVVGSLMVSYTKARAEGLALECKTGLLARPERVVILAIGLLSGTSIWAVALLAIFSQVTAIERIVHVWRVTGQTTQTDEVGNFSSGALSKAKDTSLDNRHVPTTMGMNEVKEPAVLPLPTRVPPFNNGVHQE